MPRRLLVLVALGCYDSYNFDYMPKKFLFGNLSKLSHTKTSSGGEN